MVVFCVTLPPGASSYSSRVPVYGVSRRWPNVSPADDGLKEPWSGFPPSLASSLSPSSLFSTLCFPSRNKQTRRTVLPPSSGWRWREHDPPRLTYHITTRRHNPEDCGLNLHHRENLEFRSELTKSSGPRSYCTHSQSTNLGLLMSYLSDKKWKVVHRLMCWTC
jgi:hypothetical protein